MVKSRKSRKSGNWVKRQNRDHFVKQARDNGLRARSVFKLEQIDKKYRLIETHSKVVDLGAAPGSWSQYVASKVAEDGQLLSVDLLPMNPIEKAELVQGDFTEQAIQDRITKFFKQQKIDLVLSDMAPNITGIRITDQAKTEVLQDAVLRFSLNALNSGGKLLTKLFEGDTKNVIQKRFEQHFATVQIIKPVASRAQSREIYLLARGFKPL